MIFRDILGKHHFAQGVMHFKDFYGQEGNTTRLVIRALFEEKIDAEMIVDTGAPWCILAPRIAFQLNVSERFDHEGEKFLYIRGSWYQGNLYRIPITLVAIEGADLTVDATFFVPQLRESEDWLHPNFLGLSGFLERIRFAVDPEQNYFYFGQSATQPTPEA
jgi:hypothetical protein